MFSMFNMHVRVCIRACMCVHVCACLCVWDTPPHTHTQVLSPSTHPPPPQGGGPPESVKIR